MKISPIASGGVTSGQFEGSSVNSSKVERAKAAFSGQEYQEPQGSGDPQVDRARASQARIKMKTQASVYRDGPPQNTVDEVVSPILETEKAISDTNEPAESNEETKPLSPQFAALAKAKRALQIERAQFEQEKASGSTSAIDPNEYISKADLQANPLLIFEQAGLSYDQLTDAILNKQQAPITSQDIDSMVEKKLNERLEKEFGARDTSAETQVLANIKREVQALVKEGDQFETIRQARAEQSVVDLIHRNYKETGEIMGELEAAELVENQLIEDMLPFAQLKKVQSRLSPAQEQALAQPLAQRPGTKVMRTLTNRDSASPTMDRRARAIAAMQGTLKRG